jgi:hypothetical protein
MAWKAESQGYLAGWKGRTRGIEVGASGGFHVVLYGLEINYGLDASCSDEGTLRRLIFVVLWGFRLAEGPRDEGTAVFVWIGALGERTDSRY